MVVPAQMIGRRRFISGVIPTTLAASAVLRSAPSGAETETMDQPEHQILSESEADILTTWCEAIVSGAETAQVARFVDQNLAGSVGSSLLLLRYFDLNGAVGFYRKGLAGIDEESRHQFDRPFRELEPSQKKTLIKAAIGSGMKIWKDPDPNFFYFITRSDAVDVVYGTEAGFANLDIPYLAHITPPRAW